MNNVIALSFIALYIYTLVTSISVLLLENRNPVKSLSWVIVLLFVPVFGLIIYLIFGQNFRKQKIISSKSIRIASKENHAAFDINRLEDNTFDNNQLNLIRMLYQNSDAAAYVNNSIEILSDGKSTFESMFEAIRNAKNHIQ